ncbi:MAG: hypothetical protein U5L04_14665 [Trueperaceae bacterium]|nr:hypothetical protein [Trueperaceae bacterium]
MSTKQKSPVTPSHLVSFSFDLPPTYREQGQAWQENLFYLAWKLPLLKEAQSLDKVPEVVEAFLVGDDPLTPNVVDERVIDEETRQELAKELHAFAFGIDTKVKNSGESLFVKPLIEALRIEFADKVRAELADQDSTTSLSDQDLGAEVTRRLPADFLAPAIVTHHWVQSYYYVHTVPYESPQIMMHHQFDDKTAALTYAHTVAFDEVMAYLAKKGCLNMRVQVFEHKDGHGKQPI